MPALIPAPCAASYPHQMTTLASDWNDIDAVVDHMRALRHVDKVSLLAWSLGGPRAAGYAAQHPEKVAKLVLLAPAYNRDAPADAAGAGARQRRGDQHAVARRIHRQLGSPGRLSRISTTPAARDAVWSEMLASDPVGATWGTRRPPRAADHHLGLDQAVVAKTQIPTLMVSGAHDKQVNPDRVRELYADLGSPQEGVRRPGLLLAQRHVGEEPPAAVPGVARMADERHRGGQAGRHAAPGVLIVVGPDGLEPSTNGYESQRSPSDRILCRCFSAICTLPSVHEGTPGKTRSISVGCQRGCQLEGFPKEKQSSRIDRDPQPSPALTMPAQRT